MSSKHNGPFLFILNLVLADFTSSSCLFHVQYGVLLPPSSLLDTVPVRGSQQCQMTCINVPDKGCLGVNLLFDHRHGQFHCQLIRSIPHDWREIQAANKGGYFAIIQDYGQYIVVHCK